jgi:hypothetical protein
MCVEIVFYSDNDLSVNVKDIKLTLDLSCFLKYYQTFYDVNSDKFPNFSNLDTKSQLIWLMSSEDKLLIQNVSSLLHRLNEERNSILNK